MTVEQKKAWLASATIDELLSQYVSLVSTNDYGRNNEDIALTKEEIVRRTI